MTCDSKYVLLRELGRGRSGIVFEAEVRGTDTRVAIKSALPGGSQALGLRLAEEYALLDRCRHPSLVASKELIDSSQVDASGLPADLVPEEGSACLVMELLEGPSLADANLTGDSAIEAWVQVAQARSRSRH